LRNERKYTVAETSPGIYTIKGDILPIQVIDSRKLPDEENLWLKSLSNKLDLPVLTRIENEARRQGKAVRITAYLYAIGEANYMIMKEAIEIKETSNFWKVLKETGVIARAEAEARAESLAQVAQKMKALGFSDEQIQSVTE